MTALDPSKQDHPSPHRGRVDTRFLFLGLIAGPFAWISQLVITYVVSSDACSSALALQGRPSVAERLGAMETTILIAVNLMCLLLTVSGAALSYRHWRRTREEKQGGLQTMLLIGEGRTRFIAICGMIGGLGFAVGILFNTIEPLMVPACWSVAR